jgi:NADPH-dependent curcumin reductase CurA
MGAKVYAIAGTEEKCEWLEKECGVEKAFNYKSPTFLTDFKKTVKYLDVYFDNVGGDILDFMLTRLNKYARIVMCGEQTFPLRSLGKLDYLQALFPPIVQFSLQGHPQFI